MLKEQVKLEISEILKPVSDWMVANNSGIHITEAILNIKEGLDIRGYKVEFEEIEEYLKEIFVIDSMFGIIHSFDKEKYYKNINLDQLTTLILLKQLEVFRLRVESGECNSNADDNTIRLCQAEISKNFFSDRNEWVRILKSKYGLKY